MSLTIIAHRGVSSKAPENTMAAFHQALYSSANYIEIDVQLSKDGVPVVIHDTSLQRTALKDQLVSDLFWSDLQTIDVGSWFSPQFSEETIPSLEQVLHFFSNKIGVFIEIKLPEISSEKNTTYSGVSDVVKKIIEVTRKYPGNRLTPTVLGSLDPKVSNYLIKSSLDFPFIGIARTKKIAEEHLEIGIKHLVLLKDIITEKYLNDLLEKNIKTWIFTVDDIKTVNKMIKNGVNGIISNDPDIIKQ